MDDWKLFVVGDLKTPHKEYEDWNYISPQDQEVHKRLSDLIGWNCIQRRSIGFLEAYRWGADVIATVDDDNIPYNYWGKNVLRRRNADVYVSDDMVFDPLFGEEYWHRGFPIELIRSKMNVFYDGKARIDPMVQADLWDGDPDIDAIARIALAPEADFKDIEPFFSNRVSPFNSQNTFLKRDVIPHYFMFPHIGRMDDIWASYYVQKKFPKSVMYSKASVYQERNEHNLFKDLKDELIGYENNLEFATNPDLEKYLPTKSLEAFREYERLLTETPIHYQNGVMPTNEWFEQIKQYVDFRDKSVIDYGCAEGVMCSLVKEAGASQVIGIDEKPHEYTYEGIDFKNEEIGKKYKADIKIFSMIIHWLGKEESIKHFDSETLVFIFRLPNKHYRTPASWFPDVSHLHNAVKGYRLIHDEVLMEQDRGKKIALAIFKKKAILKDGLVYKTNPTLDDEWKKKLERILEVIDIPLFVEFTPNGYITKYIEATDLDGDGFCDFTSDVPLELDGKQREAVIKIFRDVLYAGIKTNCILADFTRKNILLAGDKAYLIDFDVILEGELNEDYIKLFQDMLDYLKIDYKFEGDLNRLYEYLS